MPVTVIGGSGFGRWARFEQTDTARVSTPYASQPVEVLVGRLEGHDIMFLPRHGSDHSLPPHRINYRANLWAVNELGASAVVSLATVGGISAAARPGRLMIPDQLLDYTYGRAHTYFDGDDGTVAHADMSEPYCESLRAALLEAGTAAGLDVAERGTYAATQGPRFETPAEIERLERDGADVVGMTGMPEAGLARELQLAYATVALVVNPAAGKAAGGISIEQVRQWQESGRSQVEALLARALPLIHGRSFPLAPPMRP